jgi:hypothetical protein
MPFHESEGERSIFADGDAEDDWKVLKHDKRYSEEEDSELNDTAGQRPAERTDQRPPQRAKPLVAGEPLRRDAEDTGPIGGAKRQVGSMREIPPHEEPKAETTWFMKFLKCLAAPFIFLATPVIKLYKWCRNAKPETVAPPTRSEERVAEPDHQAQGTGAEREITESSAVPVKPETRGKVK